MYHLHDTHMLNVLRQENFPLFSMMRVLYSIAINWKWGNEWRLYSPPPNPKPRTYHTVPRTTVLICTVSMYISRVEKPHRTVLETANKRATIRYQTQLRVFFFAFKIPLFKNRPRNNSLLWWSLARLIGQIPILYPYTINFFQWVHDRWKMVLSKITCPRIKV